MVEAGKWAARKLVFEMGFPEWGGTCIADYGNHTTYASKFEEIMSKYRPIAPKPSNLSQSLHECNYNSDYVGVVESSSRFAKAKGNYCVEGGRPSRTRKRALNCCVSPSARGQKRSRLPNTTIDLASERSHSVGIGSGESTRADRSKITYFSNCSFMVDKLIVGKDPYFMEKEESSASPSEYGFAKCLGFPILGQIQQEETKRNDLVTLPLLPETPSLKDSVLDSTASNLSFTVAYSEHKAGIASHDKEEFQLRLFGRDLNPKEIGSRGLIQ